MTMQGGVRGKAKGKRTVIGVKPSSVDKRYRRMRSVSCLLVWKWEELGDRRQSGSLMNTCVKLAGDGRDIDLYHWSSERFSSAWVNTISVLLAKGRARVSVADAATDWPKRIRDMQYLDHESIVAGA